MPSITFDPVADVRNDGWGIVGGAGSVWSSLLSTTANTLYVSSPASKGQATISFPIDLSSLPVGAVVTSVTVNLRHGTGSVAAPTGTPPSITVSTVPADDTSKYTVRTIYPTSTITDTTVATYARDALGFPWDIFRLNNLLCRIFSFVGIGDCVRCYRFYCTVNYRTAPTVVINAPTGTVLTPTPTISWTYTQADGDPQAKTDYKIFTSVQQSAVSFNPETSASIWQDTVQGDVSTVTMPTAINPDSYWVHLRSWSNQHAKSVWVGRQFTIAGPTPGIPGVPDPTGTALPGTGIIQTVPDSFTGSAALTLRDVSNMASVQQADAEEPLDGNAEWTTTNAAVVRDTTIAFPGGSSSWKVTASSAANMAALTTLYEVGPVIPITARAQFLPKVTARSCRVDLSYYDVNFALISTTTGTPVTSVLGTWTDISVTDTTPSTAAYARAVYNVLSPANAEVHNIDHVGIMYGTSTPWSDGGHMSRNLLSSWYANAEGSAQAGEAWTAGTATSTGTTSPPGTGGSGLTCNSMTYLGLSPSLALRAAGTVYTNVSPGNTGFTLNKPTGTATGDLMLAYVTSAESTSGITPPAGWTLVDTANANNGSNDSVLFILKRTAGGAEPSTWAGTFTVGTSRTSAVVVGYSGAADASTQFIGEAQGSTVNANTYLTTPAVNNTDPNAWRASAFVVNDASSAGTMTANILPPSVVPAITFVGAASPWRDTSGSSSYTINKPSGVVSGDLMIATVACASSGSITAPSGWTVVNTSSGANEPIRTAILKRTAGGSEPSTWTGTVTSRRYPQVTQCVAYRNCADASLQFIATGITDSENGSSVTTPTVTNTNSLGWRVCSFAAGGNYSDSWSGGDVAERCDASAEYVVNSWFNSTYDSITVSMSDSNGSVGTGNYAKTAYFSENYYSATAWIGIIKPLSTPPTPGTNETSRASTSVGSSNPWNVVNVFDSNGVVPLGSSSVTAAYSQTFASAAGWIGIIKPATPVRAGQATATMATTVDLSNIDPSVMALAGGSVAVTGSFIGSTGGTPYLTVNFYRANQLLNTLTQAGTSFGTGTWQKSSAVFGMPDGTTRMSLQMSVTDRNVSDVVYFDRVSLALGSDTTWRPGTYRAAHPVWAIPQIQYAEDDGTGYGPWLPIPGESANPPSYDPLTGIATYEDHTVVPLTNRKYRARTVSYGLKGDQFVSPWGPESDEFSFTAENWWLKDISNPSNNLLLKVKWQTFSLATQNTATQYQPTGSDFPIVLTEGFKSDLFVVDLIPVNQLDYAQLKSMLRSGQTLFLQSDVDNAWWVKSVADISADLLPSNQRKSNPLREIKVTFVQVAPPS